MTREEIKNRMEEIEKANFRLQMKNHWTTEDFATNRKQNQEWNKLNEKLKELEKTA